MKKRWGFKRYNAMCDWWAKNGPPVYIAAAAYLGLIKSDKPAEVGDLGDLIKMAGPGGMIN